MLWARVVQNLLTSAVILTSSHQSTAIETPDVTVRSFLISHKVPGAAVALVRDGKVLSETLYGSASLQLNVNVNRNTKFQLASVTKVFTTITLLKLEQEGRLSIDDHVSYYLPGLPTAWQSITLRQLATHTSGLPDLIESSDKPLTQEELARSTDDAMRYAESLPITSPPGTQFKYDQTNYVLLLRVIEKACEVPFRDCVKRHVLDPAGMVNTVWGDAREIVPNRSQMYTALHDDRVENGANLFTYPRYLDAAAGLNSDIADMERLASALTSGALLSARELQRFWEPAARSDGRVFDISKEMEIQGVVAPTSGWFFADNSEGEFPRVFMAGGSAVSILVLPKQNLCVVVLTNLQDKDDPLPVAEGLVKVYLPGFTPML